jgi:copper chaperone
VTDDSGIDTLAFDVSMMTCAHCEAAVMAEVGRVEGVEQVGIDLTSKTVIVTGDGVSHDAIVATIEEAGFDIR